MKPHGINPTPERPLYSEFVSSFAELEQVSFPSAHTVLLIVADAHEVSTETIARIAERFLASGLIYVCVWGPDCERVHDIFDEVYVGDDTTTPSSDMMMSTWHDDEPLEEAIWFFLECAFPLDHKIDTTSYVAITVGSAEWASAVERSISDLPAFKSRMLDDELDVTGDT
ncbi:MAG TPA: hypothetical protein VK961_20785 [Chthoniobacter sp.]|nr:hypothetical protein [Chthoniobacter sp.]